MKNFAKLLWMAGLVALSSCMMEAPENGNAIIPGETDPGEGSGGSLSLTIPGGFSVMSTRAMTDQQEVDIDDLFLLVFDDTDAGAGVTWGLDKIEQINIATDLEANAATPAINDYTVDVTLPSGVHNVVLLANVGDIITANGGVAGITALAAASKTYAALTGLFTASATSKLMSGASPAIPMWGESGQTTITSSSSITINLLRALAKIEVGVGAWSGTAWNGLEGTIAVPGAAIPFTMSAVYVVKGNNRYQVIPTAANFSASDDEVTAPSIPASTGQISLADSETNFAYSGANLLREIYVPEAVIAGEDREDRMAIVVKGRYTGASGSGTDTYYRVDFTTTGSEADLVNILRNVNYRFDISRVGGNGQTSVEKAYNSASTNMQVNVVEWDDDPMGNGVFIGEKYIMMSEATPIDVSSVVGSTKAVTISTNFDNFTLDIGADTHMTVANGLVSAPGTYAPAGGAFSYALAKSGTDYVLTITTAVSSVGTTHGWTIDANDIASLDFNVRQTAAATTYTVATSGSNGTAVANHTTAIAGTTIEVLATPSANYVFTSWSLPAGVAPAAGYTVNSNPIRFSMPASNVSVSATFSAQSQPVTVVPENSSWGTPTFAPASPTAGQTVTISPAPSAGYQFSSYTVISGGVAINASNQFTMPAGLVSIRVNYVPIDRTITINNVAGGTISQTGAASLTTAKAGQTIRITSAVSAGYRFVSWTVTGASPSSTTTNPATFTMPAGNVTVTATYASNYTITLTNSANGTEVSSASSASTGASFTATATPDAGYYFNGWTAAGIALSAAQQRTNPLTLTMGSANITLTPSFVGATAAPAGSITLNNLVWASRNSIPTTAVGGQGAGVNAAFQSTPYIYDGENQITWTQATGGVAGQTAPGVCPPGWRLPSVHEYYSLVMSNATTFRNAEGKPAGYYYYAENPPLIAAAGNIESEYARGSNPYYTNTRKADGSGWNTAAEVGQAVPGEVLKVGGGTLFFPASGYSGGAYYQGTAGHYWSSSELSASLGFRLHFHASNVDPANVNDKTYRFSVRCVRPL